MKKLFLRLQPPVFLKRLCCFILVFVLAFGLWFGSCERVEASGLVPTGTWTYYGVDYKYFLTDSISWSNNSYGYNYELILNQPCYVLVFKNCVFVASELQHSYTVFRNGALDYTGTSYLSKCYYSQHGSTIDNSNIGYSYNGNMPTSHNITYDFLTYILSEDFDNLLDTREIYLFEKHSAQMDIAVALKKASASVQDGVLSASWDGVTDMNINMYVNSLVDVSINYTNLDTGITYDIEYPFEAASSGLNVNFIKPGNTYYLVTDNGFEIDLSELEEDYFKTTNYVINSICLTPYYFGKDNVISDNVYIGLSSVIKIGYDSTVGDDVVSDSTQVILPGTNYDPDDPFKSLYDQQNDLFQGMINGYDNTGMNQDNAALSDSLSGYDAATGAIFDSASDTLNNFSFEDIFSFSIGLVTALGFVKGFVDDFFVASGDFTVIVTVVFTLVFLSIVIGIARFKGK